MKLHVCLHSSPKAIQKTLIRKLTNHDKNSSSNQLEISSIRPPFMRKVTDIKPQTQTHSKRARDSFSINKSMFVGVMMFWEYRH